MLKNLWISKFKWPVIMALFLVVVVGPLQPAVAGDKPFTYQWKDYTLYTPVLSDLSVGYAYDFIGAESLVLGEFKVVDWKSKAYLTAGGLLNASSNDEGELKESDRDFLDGIPFIGLHTPMPIAGNRWTIGWFYARDFDLSKNLTGFKTNYDVKFW